MCQGVSGKDSSHMFSLIVMYPWLPYICPMVQMRKTRQAIWEKLWHRSLSTHCLCERLPVYLSRLFCLLCLPLALSHLVQLSVWMYNVYVCVVTVMPYTTQCRSINIPSCKCSTEHRARSNQEAPGTRGKQGAAMTSSSSGHTADSHPLSEPL